MASYLWTFRAADFSKPKEKCPSSESGKICHDKNFIARKLAEKDRAPEWKEQLILQRGVVKEIEFELRRQ
jgi:hypothetical protein